MQRVKLRESSDPYYDLVGDYDLIVASFSSQYGIRMYSKEFQEMKWMEFKALLAGLGPDTPLGRIISIRAEDDKETLKNFTPEQRKIRNEWRQKKAKMVTQSELDEFLESMQKAFVRAAGGMPDGE